MSSLLEEQLRASLARLGPRDTETPPSTKPGAMQEELHAIARSTRARRYWSDLSDFHKAQIAIERLDKLIDAEPDDPTLPWIRMTFIDGLPKLVRDMLRGTGVIA